MISGYFINLDASIARRDFMESQISRLGLQLVRHQAFQAASLTPEDRALYGQRPAGLPPYTQGEIACYLSHYACWTKIAAGSAAYGAVFEDDVLMSDRLPALLQTTDWIPEDAGLLRLETVPSRHLLARAHAHEACGHFHLHRYLGNGYGTAAYILRRETAEKLVEIGAGRMALADVALFTPSEAFLPELPVYQLVPAPCVQQAFYPDLQFLPVEAEGTNLEADRMRRKAAERALRRDRSLLSQLRRLAQKLRSAVTRPSVDQMRCNIPFDAAGRGG